MVAVDWAWCGTAPIGSDLGTLLGMSANLGDIDEASLPALERLVYDAYLAELRDSVWAGDPTLYPPPFSSARRPRRAGLRLTPAVLCGGA